jgi:hypothetical protein
MVWAPLRWRHTVTRRPSAAAAPGLLGDLQGDTVEAHDIVAADEPFALLGEQVIEVVSRAQRDEGAGGISRRAGELGVVVGDELLAQVGIGRLEGADPGEAQFVDEAALPSAVEPFDTAAGLRRVAGDVVDPEACEDAADHGEVRAIHAAAGGGRVEGPAGPVGVERHRHAAGGEDGAEGAQSPTPSGMPTPAS